MEDKQRLERLQRYFTLAHKRLQRRRHHHEIELRRAQAHERDVTRRLVLSEQRVTGTYSATALRWRAAHAEHMRADARDIARRQKALRGQIALDVQELSTSEARLKAMRNLITEATAIERQQLARLEQAEVDQRAGVSRTGDGPTP